MKMFPHYSPCLSMIISGVILGSIVAQSINEGPVDFLLTTDRSNISNTDEHYVVRMVDPEDVATARAELNKTESFKIVAGTINATSVEWNPGWSFHLIPTSIEFGDLFIEVCDANVIYVEDNLDDVGGAFLPSNFWCPWNSQILQELPMPAPSPTTLTPTPSPTTLTPTPSPTTLPTDSPTTANTAPSSSSIMNNMNVFSSLAMAVSMVVVN